MVPGKTGRRKEQEKGVSVKLSRLWTGALIRLGRVAETLTRLWSEAMQEKGNPKQGDLSARLGNPTGR